MSATIRFDDGAAYEETMGLWSQATGRSFLAWLAPPPGAAWLDIGCGSGTFTRMVAGSCAPSSVAGIDPSAPQLAHARQLPAPLPIDYREGDAQALPFPDASFDQAVMALVIFFVPEPARAVAEMARVLRPGGTASAYAWHAEGGGSPLQPVVSVLQARGHKVPTPPSTGASDLAAMQALWSNAGFTGIQTCAIDVGLPFAGFDAYWSMMRRISRVGPVLAGLDAAETQAVRTELQRRVAPDGHSPFTATARANAVRGHLPGAS